MKPHMPGMSTRPHLYIQTQFSEEEESQNLGHFQFQPKDVISEASSYEMHDRNDNSHLRFMNRVPSDIKKLMVAGIVQMDFTVNSWKINALFDAFDLMKQMKPRRQYSHKIIKSRYKELQQCKSVANLRNSNNILNRRHERKNSGSSGRDLERAEVLNEIITKLNSRQKSAKGKSQANSQPKSLTKSHKSVEKKLLVKQKLKKLETILKDYKLEHQQSTQKSTVYYTKHNDKRKKLNKEEDQSYLLENSNNVQSEIKVGTFKKLKNDIMHVKTQVNELREINQVYRRENLMLRSHRGLEEHSLRGRESYRSTDKEERQPIQVNYQSRSFQPQMQPSFVQSYPMNYPSQVYYQPPPQPIVYQPPPQPHYIPHFSQTYSPIINPTNSFIPTKYFKEYPSQPLSYRQQRCRDARHEHFWQTMIPDNMRMNISSASARDQPIVFCFKCGCKCAEKDDRLNVTERKDYASSSVNRFKDLF